MVVLPARGSDPISGVWSEACAEAIAGRLAGCSQLRVIPSRRAQSFAAVDSSPEETGRVLNVRCAIVCHAVLHDRFVDLRVEIIDVFSESVLASETLLGSTDRMLTLQDEAAHLLTRHFGVEDRSPRRARMRANQSSYGLCVKARALARNGAHREAIATYGQAIAVAPDHVSTLVEFTRLVATLPCRFVDAFGPLAAREAADRALRLAPDCAQAWSASAVLHCRFDHDWRVADREFQEAVHRDESASDIHHARGMYLLAMRRFEEAEHELRFAALDGPESEQASGPALLAFYEGRFADAAAQLQSVDASWWLIRALVLDGRIAEAAALVSQGDVRSAAIVAAFAGQISDALSAAERIDDDPYDAALVFALVGDAERALDFLDQARSLRSPNLMFAGVDPFLLPLREKRDFRDFLIELGLP